MFAIKEHPSWCEALPEGKTAKPGGKEATADGFVLHFKQHQKYINSEALQLRPYTMEPPLPSWGESKAFFPGGGHPSVSHGWKALSDPRWCSGLAELCTGPKRG